MRSATLKWTELAWFGVLLVLISLSSVFLNSTDAVAMNSEQAGPETPVFEHRTLDRQEVSAQDATAGLNYASMLSACATDRDRLLRALENLRSENAELHARLRDTE